MQMMAGLHPDLLAGTPEDMARESAAQGAQPSSSERESGDAPAPDQQQVVFKTLARRWLYNVVVYRGFFLYGSTRK